MSRYLLPMFPGFYVQVPPTHVSSFLCPGTSCPCFQVLMYVVQVPSCPCFNFLCSSTSCSCFQVPMSRYLCPCFQVPMSRYLLHIQVIPASVPRLLLLPCVGNSWSCVQGTPAHVSRFLNQIPPAHFPGFYVHFSGTSCPCFQVSCPRGASSCPCIQVLMSRYLLSMFPVTFVHVCPAHVPGFFFQVPPPANVSRLLCRGTSCICF